MSAPQFTPAQKAATLIQNQVLGLQTQVAQQCNRLSGFLANGVPEQGPNPAVSAADLATALGSNLETIKEILAALKAAVPSS